MSYALLPFFLKKDSHRCRSKIKAKYNSDFSYLKYQIILLNQSLKLTFLPLPFLPLKLIFGFFGKNGPNGTKPTFQQGMRIGLRSIIYRF